MDTLTQTLLEWAQVDYVICQCWDSVENDVQHRIHEVKRWHQYKKPPAEDRRVTSSTLEKKKYDSQVMVADNWG